MLEGTGRSVQGHDDACLHDQEVSFRAQACIELQDLRPGTADLSLLEESTNFLSQTTAQQFQGKNTLAPDVMLKLGDDELPAHRFMLSGSSDMFKAMFQVSFAHLEQAAV